MYERRIPLRKATIIAALLILVSLGTMSLTACGPTETRTNNFSVGASPEVEVEVGNGNVSLVVGEAGEINVEAVLRSPDNIDYKVYQEGDKVIVEAETRLSSRADVTVMVPKNTGFGVVIGNGNADVVDIEASGGVVCGNGSLSLEGVKGDVSGSIGNGGITASNITGSCTFNIGNGNSTVSNATGSLAMNTGNGSITVRNSKGSFGLNSGNGQIKFQGELTPGGKNNMTAGNGAITAELMGTPSVALDLEIQQRGRISYSSAVKVREKSEYRLKGTIGDGEAELTIRTGTGNITIK
jgi:hypothetical protein